MKYCIRLPIKVVFCSLLVGASLMASEPQLETVDKEIERLKEQLYNYYREEMKEDIEGEGLMIADWQAYAKRLEIVRKEQKEVEKTQAQIKLLEDKRVELLKQKAGIRF